MDSAHLEQGPNSHEGRALALVSPHFTFTCASLRVNVKICFDFLSDKDFSEEVDVSQVATFCNCGATLQWTAAESFCSFFGHISWFNLASRDTKCPNGAVKMPTLSECEQLFTEAEYDAYLGC